MSEDTRTESPLIRKLRSIDERMEGVTEEEVLEALSENTTQGGRAVLVTVSASVEQRARRNVSASTQTS